MTGAVFAGGRPRLRVSAPSRVSSSTAPLRIFKHPVKVIASGRTDSGVHAKGQVISFKADTRMKPLEIQNALNSLLPQDIAVCKALEVKSDFHARYSVKEKTYRYTLLNRKRRSVFLRGRAYFYPFFLNIFQDATGGEAFDRTA